MNILKNFDYGKMIGSAIASFIGIGIIGGGIERMKSYFSGEKPQNPDYSSIFQEESLATLQRLRDAGYEIISGKTDERTETSVLEREILAPSQMSHEGLEFLKTREGFRRKVYLDSAGKPTIGYGHLIKPGENYSVIDESKAEELLREDVAWAQNTVAANVQVEITQNQFDALTSFTYNIGASAFENSTLLKKLNERDYVGAAGEFDRWINVNKVPNEGLKNRRNAEEELFLSQ